jgi:photosystem II stability/assembly factor-like uncharacterized protein
MTSRISRLATLLVAVPVLILISLTHVPVSATDRHASDARQGGSSSAGVVDPAILSGLELRTIGPANMSGRIVDIAVVEADPYTFYAASATGGLWKTTDNGVTFKAVFEHENVHSIGSVTLHQANPEILWVGTGERANRQSSSWGDGVYKSTDGGRTWANMGLQDSHHIGRIALDPRNADVVFVAAMGQLWGPNKERGLFKSTDGGRTWTNVLFIDEDTGVVDVAMDPTDPNVMYAAAYQRRRQAFGFHGGGPGSGLYKSIDGGSTWRLLTRDLPAGDMGRIGISIYRSDPRIVYVCIEQGVRYNASTAYIVRKGGVYRSENKGETWTHMSDWNPRPMYASQIAVDPNDSQRIYMMNSYSVSTDGGKTFAPVRQSLHGDDRFLWINPKDSRHLIKADDGGVGISYDRGLKWLFVTSLPVSQYYRVAVDMRTPFWVYGGLQDNGCWRGPSATYFSSGVLNEDWARLCGGDGFLAVPDPTDADIVYVESQFLGLSRFNLATGERRDIRPDNARGFIGGRRNWATWGKPDAVELPAGNVMAPANWDAPFIISPHDPKTLYAGTNELWKSTDRGDMWVSLGDLTTGVDRSKLTIMGQAATDAVLSLDDGVPYYPTLTAIAESPMQEGLLYVGTDDGNLQVSRDGGATWRNVRAALPGAPASAWINGIEPSRHDPGAVYVVIDNHRSGDFRNYLFKSTDFGNTWTSIVGDLPKDRVLRTVREDPRNPQLLYVGAELGLYLTFDSGSHWVELKNNMPRVAVNDLVIHPRDNALVLGTHSRGIWILDNVGALQELTPPVLARDAHLFTLAPAVMIRYSNPKAHAGDMIFRGQNPPAGAVIDYYLREEPQGDVAVTVHDASGAEVRRLAPTRSRGINRIVWDLRHPPLPPPSGSGAAERGALRVLDGPLVAPGTYQVRLVAGDKSFEQPLMVSDDPRVTVTGADRKLWTDLLLRLGEQYNAAGLLVEAAQPTGGRSSEVYEGARELQRRIGTLYGAIAAWTGRPTADQEAQARHFATWLTDLRGHLDR